MNHEQFNNAALQCLFDLSPNLRIMKTNILEYARPHFDDIVKTKLDNLTIEPLNIPKGGYQFIELFYYLCDGKNLGSVSIPLKFHQILILS